MDELKAKLQKIEEEKQRKEALLLEKLDMSKNFFSKLDNWKFETATIVAGMASTVAASSIIGAYAFWKFFSTDEKNSRPPSSRAVRAAFPIAFKSLFISTGIVGIGAVSVMQYIKYQEQESDFFVALPRFAQPRIHRLKDLFTSTSKQPEKKPGTEA